MKEKSKLLEKKIYLYLTEFFAGMSVMAVELGASRLLAPYFSSSQIVWTMIIGTIMIAMALGNYFGGKWADKDPDPDRLYKRMIISAVWIAAIPFFGKLIIIAVSALLLVSISTNFLIWAAFLSCMAVFVFPLFLLGTVTPSLVKYTTDSLDDNGKTVGTLGAFNTIGSIIGTFAPTFITIPAVGTAVTFLIFSGILFVLGVIYFVSCKRKKIFVAVTAVMFAALCILSTSIGFAFWEKTLAYEGESVYNYLQVKEDGQRAVLSTNVLFGVQSVYMKQGGLSGLYYDTAMAAPLMSEAGESSDILILGNGTGTYATQCRAYFPETEIDAVEIDESITELAYRYFDLDDDINVVTYDGRAYLNGLRRDKEHKKYDVIMVDAYQDITIPFQMSSVEFFRLVNDCLKPGGVMVVNMNMHSDKKGSINYALSDTICEVFDYVYTIPVKNATNRELFASNSKDMLMRFQSNTEALTDDELKGFMKEVGTGLEWYESEGNVLTDDKAPVELLGMQVIDDLISEQLEHYKKVFKEDGIEGLLNE
ncbi:fused MFS/spermidine synthase [Ruminococcus sp. NK3A76]|uniref:spermidine synthase n=1 Tax=Ruminococcus sp. NK3A76 TaxID=877411 RepID=UPI00048B3C87|nr:fused MFS/spermidine synthase [Ruminococcus sp. NK3A76]